MSSGRDRGPPRSPWQAVPTSAAAADVGTAGQVPTAVGLVGGSDVRNARQRRYGWTRAHRRRLGRRQRRPQSARMPPTAGRQSPDHVRTPDVLRNGHLGRMSSDASPAVDRDVLRSGHLRRVRRMTQGPGRLGRPALRPRPPRTSHDARRSVGGWDVLRSDTSTAYAARCSAPAAAPPSTSWPEGPRRAVRTGFGRRWTVASRRRGDRRRVGRRPTSAGGAIM